MFLLNAVAKVANKFLYDWGPFLAVYIALHMTPTPEQRELCETVDKFLARDAPSALVRQMAMDGPTFDRAYWEQFAMLGGTSLLVPEDRGGGSLTDNPYDDAGKLAELSGRHVAPGPLIPANLVAYVLGATPGDALDDLRAGVLDGSKVPAW